MRPLASLQFNASALSANIASHNSSCGLLTPRFLDAGVSMLDSLSRP